MISRLIRLVNLVIRWNGVGDRRYNSGRRFVILEKVLIQAAITAVAQFQLPVKFQKCDNHS